MTFSKNLKAIRLKNGFSQKQVAEFLNISPQSISKWEKGEALPSIDFLPQLSKYLRCEINDFFALISSTDYDLDAVLAFFEFYNNYYLYFNKSLNDISDLLDKHPHLSSEITCLCDELLECKTINREALQTILGCSETEAENIIYSLVQCNLVMDFGTSANLLVKDDHLAELKTLLAAWGIIHDIIKKRG